MFLLVTGISCSAQTPAERYQQASKVLAAHTPHDGFLHDDSPAAIAALQELWKSEADAVIQYVTAHPEAEAKEVDQLLCSHKFVAPGCTDEFRNEHDFVRLAPNLYVLSIHANNGGTVDVIGSKAGKPALLWSLDSASIPHPSDPHDLIGAWKADRAGAACREKGSGHPPGSCGDLYAAVGLLPPDARGRPRFYVDAGYEQDMGATVGKQTSIWRWDGDRSDLEWIEWYDYMIEQEIGTTFDEDKGVLSIGQKGNFRTFFDCGSCIERPMQHSVLLTKTGVKDLGVRSLVPEVDLIDELIWRLAHRMPTATIASGQAVHLLAPQVLKATQDSRRIDPNFYSVGMSGAQTTLTSNGARVCFISDDLDPFVFDLRRKPDGGYFIRHVIPVKEDSPECAEPTYFPPPKSEKTEAR